MVHGVNMAQNKRKKPTYDQIVCCFQGGGALGSYQVGVLRALDEAGYYPEWFVGTSIGAINAAIAAGNPENIRIEKMYQFWDRISTPELIDSSLLPDDLESRKIQHLLSAQSALFFGQPGFFSPRWPSMLSGFSDSPDRLSFYDTSPLKSTLEEFIDFDRINSKKTRLSLGAIEVCSGEIEYFDSIKQKIGPEHVMASGALPPGFPAIKINDKYYWDGGLSSNSPASYVLSRDEYPKKVLCFAIHLFDSLGMQPHNIDEVLKRKKDITFSSRFTKMLHLHKQIHQLKNTIHELTHFIPHELKKKPKIQQYIKNGCESTIALVRFLYELDESEFDSKDYEFSKKTIYERIERGYRDGQKAVKDSSWCTPIARTRGITLHDMSPHHYLKED